MADEGFEREATGFVDGIGTAAENRVRVDHSVGTGGGLDCGEYGCLKRK